MDFSSTACAKNCRTSGLYDVVDDRATVKITHWTWFSLLLWFQSRLVLSTCVCCNISVIIVDDDRTAMAVHVAAKRFFAFNNYNVIVDLSFVIFILLIGKYKLNFIEPIRNAKLCLIHSYGIFRLFFFFVWVRRGLKIENTSY